MVAKKPQPRRAARRPVEAHEPKKPVRAPSPAAVGPVVRRRAGTDDALAEDATGDGPASGPTHTSGLHPPGLKTTDSSVVAPLAVTRADEDRGEGGTNQSASAPEAERQATAVAEAVGIDATLLANFTHQIINPLNGVLGTIDNLIDGTIQGDRRTQRLKAVRGQLMGTIELVRNLAFLSDLSTQKGREGLRQKALDVNLPTVIIEAAQFLQEMAERRRIQVQLTDRFTQYTVKGHKALLRQVFTNIVENGIKYSDEGTAISIVAHGQKHTGRLLVEVESYGPGFSTADRERIFGLGYRGAEAQRVRASGSGLGLFICRQILELHDATIEAEYSPSTRKTVFRIRFSGFEVDEEKTAKETKHAREGEW